MKHFIHRYRIGAGIALLLVCLLALFSCKTDAEKSPLPTTVPTTVYTTSSPHVPDTTTAATTTLTQTHPDTSPLNSTTVSEPSDTVSSDTTGEMTIPSTSTPTTAPIVSTAPITSPSVTTAPITSPPATTPPATTPPATTPSVFETLPRNAAYVTVYDLTAEKLLYTTGEDQVIYPASTTKLLTLLYALTIVDENTIFTIGDEIKIAPADSSKAHLWKWEQYTLRDIVAALLLPSGNDAAYTLAVTCGRKLANDNGLEIRAALALFMEGLNDYAASLGLSSTHFVTPDGYHDDAHVTTMGDMLTIARMAMEHPLLAEIMAMPTYEVTDIGKSHSQIWMNSNFLLHEDQDYYYPYATGCKTGFHTPAGACLIATAEKDGHELMVMIFKCSNKEARFSDAIRFLELGFELLNT